MAADSFGRAWGPEFDLAALQQRASGPPAAVPHYAPDRVADIEHIRLDLTLDYDARTLSGVATHSIRAVADPLDRIDFDAVDLRVSNVTRNGRTVAEADVSDRRISIPLDPPLQMGEAAEIAIHYSVTEPVAGLYFIAPDARYPDKPKQAWTQGQDEDSRYWFPCHDYPNQKSTSEMIVRVPRGWFALSNGRLVERVDDDGGGRARFHWKHETPHVTYLITLAAGEFVESTTDVGGVPVSHYVPPGREADGKRSFGNTPRMVRFFGEKIGVPYPYAKYAEIAVADFIFGGMENTTATTQTDLTLHDGRAHIDFTSDGLVAHELAHQWFGDLLTCMDWSHAWLNEGFASFFQALWTEENEGLDEYRHDLRAKALAHIQADARERRPIVCNRYEEPIDLFDTHIYQKGACALHMLRHLLGDAGFFRSIRRYVEAHRGGNVETQDLVAAVQAATGRNMQRFFDQWVYGEGHPELECSWAWDEAKKQGTLTVRQKQEHPFWLPADVAVFDGSKNAPALHRVEVERKEQSFVLDLPKAPRAVRFDYGDPILKTLKFPRPRPMLEFLLKEDPDSTGRIEAAEELGRVGTKEAVDALASAMARDRFWGVQAAAAEALGKIRSDRALQALLEGVKRVKHPKGRRAVCKALGEFRDDRAADALIRVLREGDESWLVEAEAASALGRTKSDRALEGLRLALGKDSWNEVIRSGACEGVAALERREGLDLLEAWTEYGRPQLVRGAAFRAIGRIGRAVPDVASRALDVLSRYASETFFRTRMNLIGAMRTLGEDRAIPTLSGWAETAADGRIRRAAREAIAAIRKGRDRQEDVAKIRQDMDKLTEENRKLRDRVERLESPPKPRKAQARAKKRKKRR